MSKGYQRADSLAEILAKRAEKQRLSSADKMTEIIEATQHLKGFKYGTLQNPYQFKKKGEFAWAVVEEKDLRKEIPGQLDIQRAPKQITKEMLDKIKDLPINRALTEAYRNSKKDKE